jgi:ubiquinone/menaquinone biosynthesis C-methylase UbiE
LAPKNAQEVGVSDPHFDAGAGGYDQMIGRVSRQLSLGLFQAAQLSPDSRVLDVATGTGVATEVAAQRIGPSGFLVASDISAPMLHVAIRRLSVHPNVAFCVADGAVLPVRDGAFDAVLCGLALMYFANPRRGLSEFLRVLRPGGRCALSTATRPERSFVSRVNAAIGRHVPSRADAAAKHFSLGEPGLVRSLLGAAGFQDVEETVEAHSFHDPSFDAYFRPVEEGEGATGAEFVMLPRETQEAIREEVRRELQEAGRSDGPIDVPVEVLVAVGWRP